MAISNQPEKLVWRVACSRLLLKILADFQLGLYLPAGRQACKVKLLCLPLAKLVGGTTQLLISKTLQLKTVQ